MNNDDTAVDEGGFDSEAYFPVLSELAKATSRARTLSTFAELSLIAGRAGDTTDDWRADMSTAVATAFAAYRAERREEIERLLTAAFYAGCDQATISAAPRPERAMKFARARATLHELQHGDVGPRTSAHELETAATAYFLALKLPIHADEAAACSVEAMREAGFSLPMYASEAVLEAAGRGLRERESWEAAGREYQERQTALLGSILGEGLEA